MSLIMKDVSKSFPGKLLFQDLSYRFETGCYAIVGPNGVGKTVLLEMLAGVSLQDTGSIVLNEGAANISMAYKKQLTYVPSQTIFFPTASGADFLSFILSVKSETRTDPFDPFLSVFQLHRYLNMPFSKMSLGTQKKFFLTTLAIGKSQLIILDEPTNGLDAESKHFLRDTLSALSTSSTIIIATHDDDLLTTLSPTIIRVNPGTGEPYVKNILSFY